MNRKFCYLLFLCLIAVGSAAGSNNNPSAPTAVWQWGVTVEGAEPVRGVSRAYMWIPENCMKLNGVVFAQHNMEEVEILEDAGFRAAMTELGFAIVWCSPSYNHVFDFSQGAGEYFNWIINTLAERSGYNELRNLPIVYMGHSATASAPYYFAAWNPERTLCAVSVSGQWPYYRGDFAPDVWGDRTIDYIPSIMICGEYENPENFAREGTKERVEHPRMPISMLACPGEGHFSFSPEKAQYIAFYIKKAMQYRMPVLPDADGRAELVPIDPTRSGWLIEKWSRERETDIQPAPVDEYKGDKSQTFWYFDREHVERTMAYRARHRGKLVPLLAYEQGGKILPQRNTHLQVKIDFVPEDENEVEFSLRGRFLDTVAHGSPRLKSWSGKEPGEPISHPDDERNITVDVICGPVRKVATDRFRLDFSRNEIRNEQYYVAFAAKYPGNELYRPIVQQAEMFLPVKIDGEPQTVSFDDIENVKSCDKSVIKLKAKSDSGLKVFYYVVEGPAVMISDDELMLTAIPPRAKFPIEVRVAAWQYGSRKKGIATADTVEKVFYIER